MSQEPETEGILDAARALQREHGDDFTMEQLSLRANLSRATVYRRVGGKETLLARLAEMNGGRDETRDARARILAAVPRVIARTGLLGATMEQIAEEAGVGVATVYRQWGDKERLLRAFIDEHTPRTTLRELIMHPGDDVQADLATFAAAVLPFLYDNRALIQIVLLGSEHERAYFNQLRTGSTRMHDLLVAYWAAQIEAGRIRAIASPRDLALAFVGVLFTFGVIGPAQYGTRLEQPEATAHEITRIFLSQLLTRANEP
jgi:AcrR family transcriptional regulator